MAPSGVYAQMIVTGNTTLAKNSGGQVTIGPAGNTSSVMTVNGAVGLNGDVGVSGSFGVNGPVTVSGSVGVNGSLGVNGPVSVSGTVGVNGLFIPGTFNSDPAYAPEGALYYNTASHSYRGVQNGSWQDISASAAPISSGLYGGCTITSAVHGCGGSFSCTAISPASCSRSSFFYSCICPSGYTTTQLVPPYDCGAPQFFTCVKN